MRDKLQFGVYQLDRHALELRKHGVLVRLQEQPLRVLRTLVERPGEIVTRETLRERIWGNDTFVDFEQSLNKAVNRLRDALDDDAGEPTFIETIPRRGYRFIAPVSEIPDNELPPIQTSPSVADASPSRPARFGFRRTAVLITVAALAIIGAAATFLLRKPRSPAPTEATVVTTEALCCSRLSRDGKLLAYASDSGSSRLRIWVKQTAGGDAIPVTDGSEDAIGEDFSPDGTHLVFASESGIRLAPTLSGESKVLARKGGYPLFSPNGQDVLYWHAPAAFMVSVDSQETISLPINEQFLVHQGPLWSPDGDLILFYGVTKREPLKPDQYWIAPLRSKEAKPLELGADHRLAVGELTIQAWIRDKKGAEWIFCSTQEREVWKLYRVRIGPDKQLQGEPELVTQGTDTLSYSVSISEDGKLAYPTAAGLDSIYEMTNDESGGAFGPATQLALPEGGDYHSPSISRDGKWMVYNASMMGKTNTFRLRNLETGTDRLLDDTGRQPGWGGEAILSPDGTKVVFERDCKNYKWADLGNPLSCAFIEPTAGGAVEQVCAFCTPRGFASDGSSLLVQNYHQDGTEPHQIDIVNLKTKTQTKFLSAPDVSIYHAFFSWDDHWVVFKTESSPTSRVWPLWIAPVRDGIAASRAGWVPLTDGRYADDKPQFSADGNTVYFTSQRDGYRCIWAQHLDPRTKHPVGAPVACAHFHTSTERMGGPWSSADEDADLTVARNRVAINLPQVRGRIWMTQIR
jgi:eukaryotic-like serine/threonine-protein kinase